MVFIAPLEVWIGGREASDDDGRGGGVGNRTNGFIDIAVASVLVLCGILEVGILEGFGGSAWRPVDLVFRSEGTSEVSDESLGDAIWPVPEESVLNFFSLSVFPTPSNDGDLG